MLIILSQLIFLFLCYITDTRWHPSVRPPGRGANPFQTGKVEYEFDKTHPDYPSGSHADLANDHPEPPFIYKENLQCKGTKSFHITVYSLVLFRLSSHKLFPNNSCFASWVFVSVRDPCCHLLPMARPHVFICQKLSRHSIHTNATISTHFTKMGEYDTVLKALY